MELVAFTGPHTWANRLTNKEGKVDGKINAISDQSLEVMRGNSSESQVSNGTQLLHLLHVRLKLIVKIRRICIRIGRRSRGRSGVSGECGSGGDSTIGGRSRGRGVGAGLLRDRTPRGYGVGTLDAEGGWD